MENNSLICVYEKSLLRKLLLLCTKKKRNKSRRCQSAKAMGSYHFSPILFSVPFLFVFTRGASGREGQQLLACCAVAAACVFWRRDTLYQAVSILFV